MIFPGVNYSRFTIIDRHTSWSILKRGFKIERPLYRRGIKSKRKIAVFYDTSNFVSNLLRESIITVIDFSFLEDKRWVAVFDGTWDFINYESKNLPASYGWMTQVNFYTHRTFFYVIIILSALTKFLPTKIQLEKRTGIVSFRHRTVPSKSKPNYRPFQNSRQYCPMGESNGLVGRCIFR